MGLDMYLHAKQYLGRYEYNDAAKAEKVKADKVVRAAGFKPSKLIEGGVYVSVPVGYWRKANQVHAWFVNNVQDGKDDCGDYYVTRENLIELRDAAQRVLDTVVKGEPVVNVSEWNPEYTYETFPDLKLDADVANAELPAQGGFFFGSTELDEYYVSDLEDTVKQINGILAEPSFANAEFAYHSSW
jgi:hypothetical protein